MVFDWPINARSRVKALFESFETRPKVRNTIKPARRAPIAILGVPFDNVSIKETVELIEGMVTSGQPHYLVTANVDFLVQASNDIELRRILFDAHLVLCDGMPLVWASRLLGNPLPERVAGSDLVPLLIRIAAEKGYRIFFLGGSPEVSAQAMKNLQEKYPTLQIAGSYSPPIAQLMEMDHDEINRRIKESKPHLLFVSFGCPKQEKWIAMHYRSLGAPVVVGVGATIDFLAGKVQRAPRWMQNLCLEWVYRLAQEPRRLLRRYLGDLWGFGHAIIRQWWRMQFRVATIRPVKRDQDASCEEKWQLIKFPSRLDMAAVQRESIVWESTLASTHCCFIDLQDVQFIDSTGMGTLIRFQKKARITGQQLVLIGMTPPVKKALALMRLTDFFTTAPDLEAAKKISEQHSAETVLVVPQYFSGRPSLFWNGELTAANVDEVWIRTRDHINLWVQRRHNDLVIDLEKLNFIDSSGVSLMLRSRKFAGQSGLQLSFINAQPNVRAVLRLMKLESMLLK